jgi:Fur family transcriptional regulator, ferric uptake regulator
MAKLALYEHSMDRTTKILRQKLTSQGFSLTAPRRQVLDAFFNESKPLTAAEVHRRISEFGHDLVSVYRAIELFCRLGVLTEVDHVPEGRRYELSDAYREHHHHLICGNCGKTEDFEDCEMAEIERLIRKRFHFQVTRHELRFLGLCQRCQR